MTTLFDPRLGDEGKSATDFIANHVLQVSTEYSIVCKDMDSTILLWNEGARRLYGYEPEDVVGKANSSILHTQEDVEAGKPRAILDVALNAGKWEGTIQRCRKNGEHFAARVVITPCRDSTGKAIGYLSISKDISAALLRTHELAHTHAAERVSLEDLVVMRQSELERAGRINLLGEMAAGLAHEINQPLAALIYTLTGAANRAKIGALNNAQMLEALQASIAHAHRSAAILSRIREMANKHTPHRCSVQLNDLVAEMGELCAITALGSGVKLRCEPDSRLPSVQADKVQIEQVLLNLIRNGIDAVLEAAGRRREVVIRTAVLDESTIEVSVEDSGKGLPPERITRMFEPFYTTKEHGMGLGLAICQSIIEEHGGAVRAENRRDSGMRVSFTLKVGGRSC